MANNMRNMSLNKIGANAKQFGQQKIVNPSAQYLNQNIGVPQVMMGALPAAAGVISSIPNYNEAIIEITKYLEYDLNISEQIKGLSSIINLAFETKNYELFFKYYKKYYYQSSFQNSRYNWWWYS